MDLLVGVDSILTTKLEVLIKDEVQNFLNFQRGP